ncbi:tripartite tricarboxylate transporter TctB family protein [Thermaerobacter sp. FW80]|uniref:tripartite tricarboxylate transporter TctB family protein n=1 Tax=Thermaerobacter sp. FW80 TaxID=2546351 RepID=UPI00143071D6|nr:tripartite tricarboxylate transporter TctB family protein [Thermaerobacter sp. FW80]
MGRLRSKDVAAGLAMVLLGMLTVQQAGRIFQPEGLVDALGPRTFPMTLGVTMVGLGLLLLVRGLRAAHHEAADLGDVTAVVLFAGGFVIYIVLLAKVGFVAANVLAVSYMLYVMGGRRHLESLLVSVSATALLYVLFAKVLHIALPGGLGL